jgi:hypothetical protein
MMHPAPAAMLKPFTPRGMNRSKAWHAIRGVKLTGGTPVPLTISLAESEN